MRLRTSIIAAVAAVAMCLSGCASVLNGTPVSLVAPNASLPVRGAASTAFDTVAKNALSDVISFWRAQYPSVAGGKSLPPISGGFFSIDGLDVLRTDRVPATARGERCLAREPDAVVNNAFYCEVDDSIVYDRNPDHLVSVLSQRYGQIIVALVFAHEFGHAIQQRLKIFDRDVATIQTESQADCAAGAFMAEIIAGKAPHFRASAQQLDAALNGYLLVRDRTPVSSSQISHGNGFDRLSAVNDGITHGVRFCYASSYFNREFTERPFVTDTDYRSGGNETLEQVLDPSTDKNDPNAGGLQPDLNRFFAAAAKSIPKPWTNVKIAEASHPACEADKRTEFDYCPDDNTVYFSRAFAASAYNSLTEIEVDPDTHIVTVVEGQPADFALGTLFAVAWGLAVRHQLFGGRVDDKDALLAAVCYTGAYAKNINLPAGSDTQPFVLSPPDMDEATSAVLNLVGQDAAFGDRGTTGLQRVQSFVKGYTGGLSAC